MTSNQGIPRRLTNGKLLVPTRIEAEHGTIGDATVEIGPDNPDFQKWSDWLKRTDAERATH